MSTHNTEKLVRKCFKFCFHETGTTYLCHYCVHHKIIARAARRFVKEENRHNADVRHAKFLRWCRRHPRSAKKASELPESFSGNKLPKHWGELKINGKWTKF